MIIEYLSSLSEIDYLTTTFLHPLKTLNTPELVPFRMTRNVVDGMGPLGTEGTFTTAAVTTLSTLKENTDALLTILSAVVADPLYKWDAVNKHANGKGGESKNDSNKDGDNDDDREKETLSSKDGSNGGEEGDYDDHDSRRISLGPAKPGSKKSQATRALARIHEKLQGYEDGTAAEQQSVESQVQFLLNAAQDPDNLCRMYEGWMPFV